MDFLVQMEVTLDPRDAERNAILTAAEAKRARELAEQGILRRLWRIPGRRANWGIWRASDASALHEALSSLPLFAYSAITVHPLAGHPNDPGATL
jgi:muconolactone delta-isomerase